MKHLLQNDMIIIGICVGCAVIAALLIVRIYAPHPCPGGCGAKVENTTDHTGPCDNCHIRVYWCVDTLPAISENPAFPEHRAQCDGCDKWYYTCEKTGVPEKEEGRYQHRIVGKREDGTPTYACKPEDPLSVPNPDK